MAEKDKSVPQFKGPHKEIQEQRHLDKWAQKLSRARGVEDRVRAGLEALAENAQSVAQGIRSKVDAGEITTPAQVVDLLDQYVENFVADIPQAADLITHPGK